MSNALPPTLALVDLPDGPALRLIDQTLLPRQEVMLDLTTLPEACEAIRSLRVRGAPAIGCAAAVALAVEAARCADCDLPAFQTHLREASATLAATRPTAVNLFWALNCMEAVIAAATDPDTLCAQLRETALALIVDDENRCRRMGAHGATLIPARAKILTHCNAGALATAGYGSALGVIRAAHEQGKVAHVWVDETRPLLQGARLTAYELHRAGIPCTVICDNMAASLMARGEVDCVVVGADRITAQGDVANKIGTYGVAVLAHYHHLPFYVAAPLSTIDYSLEDGSQIPIEQRNPCEVTCLGNFVEEPVTPAGVPAYNPAFDVTPAELVTAIFTEEGIAEAPLGESLGRWR